VKPAIFHPAARAAIRLFPEEIRRELGKAIFDLQNGAVLCDSPCRRLTQVFPNSEFTTEVEPIGFFIIVNRLGEFSCCMHL
jgi:hypothetical protein